MIITDRNLTQGHIVPIMNADEFEISLKSKDRVDYVGLEELKYMRDNMEFEVVERSILRNEPPNDKLISVTYPHNTEDMEEDEFVMDVKQKLTDRMRDIQTLNVIHNGEIPNKIQIWVHKFGYSAFCIVD